jgi:hypothetical protein
MYLLAKLPDSIVAQVELKDIPVVQFLRMSKHSNLFLDELFDFLLWAGGRHKNTSWWIFGKVWQMISKRMIK